MSTSIGESNTIARGRVFISAVPDIGTAVGVGFSAVSSPGAGQAIITLDRDLPIVGGIPRYTIGLACETFSGAARFASAIAATGNQLQVGVFDATGAPAAGSFYFSVDLLPDEVEALI